MILSVPFMFVLDAIFGNESWHQRRNRRAHSRHSGFVFLGRIFLTAFIDFFLIFVLSSCHMSDPINGTVIPNFDAKDVEDHRIVACLSYIGILCVIPLLGSRQSRFAQEHAKQGLILCVAWIAGSFIFWVPLFGWAAMVVVFAVNVIALIKCADGKFWEIPYVGQYRDKVKL